MNEKQFEKFHLFDENEAIELQKQLEAGKVQDRFGTFGKEPLIPLSDLVLIERKATTLVLTKGGRCTDEVFNDLTKHISAMREDIREAKGR